MRQLATCLGAFARVLNQPTFFLHAHNIASTVVAPNIIDEMLRLTLQTKQMCYRNVEHVQQEHMQILNPLVKTPSPIPLKLVLSGSNVSALSVCKSLYSIGNLPSLNSLRCNYGGQLSDDAIFVLTLISY